MSLSELSESTQNYLKVIWGISEHSNEAATTSLIAARTGLKQSSVSDALKRLTKAGLITHQRYGTVELTKLGYTYAISMIRRHRLIETFLVEVLEYTWDQVHDEAEILEHAVSETMIERLDKLLGYPQRDPHGDPIPSPDGSLNHPPMMALSKFAQEHWEEAQTPFEVIIQRISDSKAHVLRAFSEHHITPGETLNLIGSEGPGQLLVRSSQGKTITLSKEEADSIFIAAP